LSFEVPFSAFRGLYIERIKAVIIKVLEKENQEGYTRYEEGKGSFMDCIFIKTWINGCCLNYKKFNAYA
jgi:hypothetical protein